MKVCDQRSLEALAAAVGELLLANGECLATAESCTGGWVGQCATAIAGSSRWFERGFVTYSNEAKIETVSYTHLDVYKRQMLLRRRSTSWPALGAG